MAEITLTAERRRAGSRTSLKALRKEGKIPGVFYIHNEENIPIAVEALALRPIVYTAEAHIIQLELDDAKERKCIMREIQFDPVTDGILHFDLLGIHADEQVRLEVPVLLEGTPIGVKEGGIVQHTLHRIEVECLPADLPEHITVNIEHLHVGDVLKIEDLSLAGITFTVPADQPIVSIVHPRVVAEAEPAEATEEAEAEPEVIAKGKKEDEGEGEE